MDRITALRRLAELYLEVRKIRDSPATHKEIFAIISVLEGCKAMSEEGMFEVRIKKDPLKINNIPYGRFNRFTNIDDAQVYARELSRINCRAYEPIELPEKRTLSQAALDSMIKDN
jgi:hypothetical protein